MILRRRIEQRAVGEHSGVVEKVRALAEIVARRLANSASTSEGDRYADEVTQLLQWVTRELQFLGRM